MTTWNNCVKIYADGDFLDLEEDISFDEMMRSVQAYTNLIGKDPCETVWLDMDQKIQVRLPMVTFPTAIYSCLASLVSIRI